MLKPFKSYLTKLDKLKNYNGGCSIVVITPGCGEFKNSQCPGNEGSIPSFRFFSETEKDGLKQLVATFRFWKLKPKGFVLLKKEIKNEN